MVRARGSTYEKAGRLYCAGCRQPLDHGRHVQCRTWLTHDPSPGIGFPDPCQEPTKLADGFSSRLTGVFARFLDYDTSLENERYQRHMSLLEARNPGWYATWTAHMEQGERLTEIAERLGITPANARYRQHMAREFLRSRSREESIDAVA